MTYSGTDYTRNPALENPPLCSVSESKECIETAFLDDIEQLSDEAKLDLAQSKYAR